MRAAGVLLFLLLTALSSPALEQVLEDPFQPVSAEVAAQGGSFTANAEGWQALFYNPAGFVSPKVSLTPLSASAWVYADPVRLLEAASNWSDPSRRTGFIEEELASGGFGVGSCAGIGYVGKGLGLGAALSLDSYFWGPDPLGAQGDIQATVAFVGGLAVPVNLFGMKVALGADVRPLFRLKVPVDSATALDLLAAVQGGSGLLAALNSSSALYGFGFGIDLGATVNLGGFNFGISVRDFLDTRISYSSSTVAEIQSSLRTTGGFPAKASPVAEDHVIPMDLSAGLAYRFIQDKRARIIDPVIHASLGDLIGVIRDNRSPWELLRLGADVRLLRLLSLRAGLDRGYLSFGAGLRLLFLDLDCAVFTREMGPHPGERPSSCVAVEVRL